MTYLLSQIIEVTAKRFPEKTAFICRDKSISYAELDKRSKQLAACLYDAGIKRGDRVAIYLPKSIETATAVYGCLYAGAIYVPIDPGSPSERLKSVLNNAEAKVILTNDNLVKNISSIVNDLNFALSLLVTHTQISLKNVPNCLWNELPETYEREFSPLLEEDAAYIIYTSGSTGEPKGILHTHRSALLYAQMAVDVYSLNENDRLGNFAPLHFDQSTFDYFAGPIVGATTVLIPEEFMRFPASLSQLIEDECLTIWYSVPTALCQLALRGAIDKRNLNSLRWVLFGGENFPIAQLRECMLNMPLAKFSNVYGPAEVNQCTFYHLDKIPEDVNKPTPIGKIWPNAECKIVDETNQEVTLGTIGELLIRTPTMMVGYWNRPELNANCFYKEIKNGIEHRFYRTGDLIEELSDGNLVFHGRKDRQVKVNGHRIEMNAIEAAILKLDNIESCAVFVTENSEEQTNILNAAVILKLKTSIEPNSIRFALRQLLPVYSIPSKIIIVDSFPETGTNKIDYNKLADELS